ncbi:MAG TPA: hypothetical protein VE132_08860, partial [Micromonosporaceae bacterium]|nr:hypothetical protein [Micromonosporaceae bacterium]
AARTDLRLFPVWYVVHMPTLREHVTRRVARPANPISAPATVPRDPADDADEPDETDRSGA